MKPALVLSATAVWLAVAAFDAWSARRASATTGIEFLYLPLGLAMGFRWDLAPVAARERLRTLFLASRLFALEVSADRVTFRRDRPSPWFGALWRRAPPNVYAGSYVVEPAAGGSRLLVRFSTVPVTGWTLAAIALVGAGFAALYAMGERGPSLWLATGALLLAVRSAHHAAERAVGMGLLRQLGVTSPGASV